MLNAANRIFGSIDGNFDRSAGAVSRISEDTYILSCLYFSYTRHLLSLPNLVNRYPDARFIHLHRDPCEVIPSMANLFLHIRKPFTREMDLHEIGRDVTRQWHAGLQASMEYRKTHTDSESRFLDIHYRDLVTDPLGTGEKILGFAGIQLDVGTRGILKNYFENHPKGKHGAHRYSLEQVGLDREKVGELFSEYNSHYLSNQ